ncbi:MAG: immunoglobulin-like domain-containing protein [Candidatus Hydrogenedens sp.]
MKAGNSIVSLTSTRTTISVCLLMVGFLVVTMSAQGLVTVTKQITGLDANGYFVNGTAELSVQVTINYDNSEGTITALGYEEQIPPGFSYSGPLASENPTPPIVPNANQTGTLNFAYIFVPSFPATFTYRIACPPTICEPGQLQGKVLYRTSGPQLESAPTINVIQLEPTSLSFTRELSGPGISGVNNNFYIPGQNIYVTIRIEKEGPQPITALGFQDTLPAGWTYQGLQGGSLPVEPTIGKTGLLEFAYTTVPSFPAEFTYIVNVPISYTGIAVIGGEIVEDSETKSSAVVYRTCGDAILSPKVETQLDGAVPCLLVSRSFTRNYYIPGEVVEVTINIRINPDSPCTSSVTALGYEEFIPAGWTYEGPLASENPTPPIVPNYGATGTLSFAYIFVPNLTGQGASFTYRMKASESSSGPQTITGRAKYRLSGGELLSDIAVSELIDDTPPVLTLLGEAEVTVECGTTYVDAGATATDIPDGDLTAQIEVTNNVNTAVPGDYTVDYSVTDSSNNTVTAQRIVHVVDTTKPVINLLGDNPLVVECKSTFNDPGATATDSCDTNVGVNVSGTVDTNAVGEYTLTYTAADDSGNNADPVIRTVKVVDTTPPVITLIGPNPYALECHSVYYDPGATASDTCQGTVSVTNNSATVVNANEPGQYTITYTATDANGNTATRTRVVNVSDNLPPTVTIVGANPLTVQCGSVFTDPGATATDACDGNLTVNKTGIVNTNQVGSYQITYTATDRAGKIGQAIRTVNVVDTQAPTVTLNGASEITHECGLNFVDPGATAEDVCSGILDVIVSGYVYDNQVGDYTLTYTAVDNANNSASKTRTIHVVDTQGPEITLNQEEMTIECNGIFTDPGATALDKCEGGIPLVLTAATIYEVDAIYGDKEVEAIDTSAVGKTYKVRYVATDNSENRSEADMLVNIIDTTSPVITLNQEEMTIECNDVFTDPGATAIDSCGSVTQVLTAAAIYDALTMYQVYTIDTSSAGKGYVVRYVAEDDSGNKSSKDMPVKIVDTTKPVITLLGENTISVECKSNFTDPGATASDTCDTQVTVSVTGTVDTNVIGSYTITYTAADASGNSATPVIRTVNVVDTTKPVVTLLGSSEVVLECKSTFNDPGATATDGCSGNLEVQTVGSVNVNVPGEYTLTYTAFDASGNSDSKTRVIRIVDTQKPTITLNGNSTIEIQVGQAFNDPGATATDACAGDLNVQVSGKVNTSVPATYELVYSAQDPSGNKAQVSRKVVVKEAPIVVTGNLSITPLVVDFGKQLIEKTYKQKIVLANKGKIPVNVAIDVKDTANNVFAVTFETANIEIPSGETKYVEVAFAPKKVGTYAGKVLFVVSDGVSPAKEVYVDLTGEGYKPKRRFLFISCSPTEGVPNYLGDLMFITMTGVGMFFVLRRKRANTN